MHVICNSNGDDPLSFQKVRIKNSNLDYHQKRKQNIYFFILFLTQKTLKLILENGVDVNAVDNFGSTAVHVAAKKGNEAAILCLKSFNADFNIQNKFDIFLNSFFSYFKIFCYMERNHLTPIQVAARQNNESMVNLLLGMGVSLNGIRNDISKKIISPSIAAKFNESILSKNPLLNFFDFFFEIYWFYFLPYN